MSAVTSPTTTSPVVDTYNVLVRELRPLMRDPFSLIFSLVQPLVFLGLFGPLLVSSSGEPASETLKWFVPGILVMIALFGTPAVLWGFVAAIVLAAIGLTVGIRSMKRSS